MVTLALWSGCSRAAPDGRAARLEQLGHRGVVEEHGQGFGDAPPALVRGAGTRSGTLRIPEKAAASDPDPVERIDDVRERRPLGGPSETVPAPGAALRSHHPCPGQRVEDLREIVRRDVEIGRDVGGRYGSVRRAGQMQDGPQGILRRLREHWLNSS